MSDLKSRRPSFDRALEIIASRTRPLETEMVSVRKACGRVSAETIVSKRAAPPYDMSAMDGFALHECDVAARTLTYQLSDDIAAGSRVARQCRPGIAFPISTGAQIPKDCGAVVVKEKASQSDRGITLHDFACPGANIRRRGEDAMAGDEVVQAGTQITPAIIGALASFGVEKIDVYCRPRIGLLVTGNELFGEVRDANGPMITAALERIGAEVVSWPIVEDNRTSIVRNIEMALHAGGADIIVSTGGVSVGNHDNIPAALEAVGAEAHFHGVAMRPGKPVLFATFPNGKLFFGLPGNPVAALVAFRFFVNHALRHMSERGNEIGASIELPQSGRTGLTILLKAKQVGFTYRTEILPGQESHKLRPLIHADQWVVIHPQGDSFGATVYPLDIPV
jgi:molybdopterin molybdotransferase